MAKNIRIFRHRLSTRLWHWTNAIAVIVMLMTGLTISNAHPRLYWGQAGFDPAAAWIELPRWPGWMTIPSFYSLAIARNWHLAFAWIFAFGLAGYMIWSLFNGHFRRNISLSRAEVAPSHLWADVKKHVRLDFDDPEGRYNPLQKNTYALVLFVMLPLLILTGLALSPGMNAAMPWLLDVSGGRQSARSIHFIMAAGIGAFIVVHLLLVLLAGPINGVRSMITGWSRHEGEIR
jgi:Ni/Fe-hydrogenase b-type cytochrome subunit